jgi:hypothetical protein
MQPCVLLAFHQLCFVFVLVLKAFDEGEVREGTVNDVWLSLEGGRRLHRQSEIS